MRCPNCGSEVDEGALTCPHCQIDLSLTQRIPVTQAHWCPHCGALVTAASESCPKCGLPLPQAVPAAKPARAIRPTRDIKLPEIDSTPAFHGEKTDAPEDASADEALFDAQDPTVLQQNQADNADPDTTSAFASVSRRPAPRFESAIPSGPRKETLPEAEGIPRTRVILLSAVLVTSLVVAAIFLITHPWDPQATDNRAKVEAPVSTDPTTTPVSHLTGQDTSATQQNTSSDVVFDALESDYQKLGDLSKRLDENEKLFDQIAISGSAQERSDAQQEAEQISLDISNIISDLSSLDDSNGNYRKTIENLTKLGNWLRNRSDALSEGWDRSVSSPNPSQDKERILAPLNDIRDSGGSSSYQKLFDENYVNWKPQKQ